jgi:hypothetical protein
VASSEALDPLHWSMCAVLYRGIAMTIKTANKVGVFFIHHCVFDCLPDVRGSNTEQVVARWWRPVASDMALVDILHWAMLHELLQCLHMDIKTACDGGACVCRRRLFFLA